VTTAAEAKMPDELSPRHLGARLLQLGGLVVLIVAMVLFLPGLGEVRSRLHHATAAWLAAAVVLELGSTLSYVVVFRAVFCPRMGWKMSYQIGMAEQAANSLLPAGGAGGLALGAWALSRGGTSADHIARRSVAFFLLTSFANVALLIVFAVALTVGILGHDRDQAITLGFAAAGALAIAFTLAVPSLTAKYAAKRGPLPADAGRVKTLVRHGLEALGNGVRDAVSLLRRRQLGVLAGSFGYLAFDIAVLGACFRAYGEFPPLGILVVAYIIGQLGGLLPIPGGIGGTEGGLIGVFVLYHVPLAIATVAVLTYRAVQLWLPAVLGTMAFVQLRNTLRREDGPAMCQPLAERLEVVRLPAPAASR
jgi:uncharacterized protein (TIRG00374 family)